MPTKIFGTDFAAATALTGAETLSVIQSGAMVDTTTQAIANLAAAAEVNDEAASYTAVPTDQVVVMTSVSANTFTVPPEASVAFPIGWFLEVWQGGAGQTTIVAGSGVTIKYNAALTLALTGLDSGCSLRKVAADTWRLVGDMEPA